MGSAGFDGKGIIRPWGIHENSGNDLQTVCTMGAQPEGKENDRKESGGEAAEQVPCICGRGG